MGVEVFSTTYLGRAVECLDSYSTGGSEKATNLTHMKDFSGRISGIWEYLHSTGRISYQQSQCYLTPYSPSFGQKYKR